VTMAARLELVTVPKGCNSTARLRASGLSRLERSLSIRRYAWRPRISVQVTSRQHPVQIRKYRRTHDEQHTE
jgi:hypothetical protein